MKKYLSYLFFCYIILGCKIQLNTAPDPFTSNSISESKQDKYFISENRPVTSFIELEGKKVPIVESWTEYPHRKGLFRDKIDSSIFCLVVVFDLNSDFNIKSELNTYVKGLTNTSGKTWVMMDLEKINNDTLMLEYRS